MAQHDYNIANQSGADFRADLNNALLAIATVNSGATEPSTTFAHQLWVDTSTSELKIRNAADNAWITTGVSITASNTFTGDLTGNVVGNVTGNLVGNVTGDLTGNADSADTLSTARTISLSGDVVGSASFDGSANIDIDTVVQINSITLGTDTTGDYVESLSGGTGVTVTGGTGEGSTPSIAIGQAVATTDDVTFNTITATDQFIGDIRGAVRFNAKADGALSKGDVVYISGVSGDVATVGQAKADDASKMPAFGFAAEDANDNAEVEVVTFGTLAGLDTSGVSEGQVLYVSTTAGEYTTTKPTGESALLQNIGKVQRSHAAEGSIKVGGAGRSNATPNLNDGNIFIGNASNQAVTATLDTSIVVENTNLYYTTTRANTDFDTRLATKDTGDLTEGSNLYYTTARVNSDFDTRLATKDTGDLTEGVNLYYTDARVNSAFDTRLATKDTDDVSEGVTNLYYTSARANTDFDTRLATKSTTDLAEGTNLYYTSARFDSAFTSKDTDDLSEGTTNLYYTTTRFDSAFGNKTTSDLTEGTNLYYTDTRANSAIDTRVTKAFVDALGIQASSVDANSVTLGTDTVGNYVATVTGTANKITVTGSGSESANITLSLPDDVQIADSLTVAGNLTVNGTLTSLDTTNLDIEDNLFQLNAGLTGSPVNDSGMLINRGTADNSIFMWDESVDKFTLGLTTADGTATGNITLNSLGTLVANIEGDVTGAVTGTVSSLSNHDTDDLAEGTNLYYTQARFDSAFTAKSTSDLSEGSNLYYTDARFDTRLATKDTDDISEGTSNLYYTSARFDSAFGGKSTSDLSEGTNLYYTSARANADFDTRLATKDTGDLSEGSNLYYTDARADARVDLQTGANLDLSSKSTSDLSEGSNLYYTDARVQAVSINNVIEDTTPQLGGNLDLNSSDITGTGDINITGTIQSSGNITGTLATASQPNITSLGTLTGLTVTGEIAANGGIALGDSDKATFGASDDLQIFHTGSSSVITDTGTGDLKIRANNLLLEAYATEDDYLTAIDGGAVTIFYDGSAKLATTSTGIDVTGTVTADDITASGIIHLSSADPIVKFTDTAGGDTFGIFASASNFLGFYNFTDSRTDLVIDGSGNVGINLTDPQTYGGFTVKQQSNTSFEGIAVLDSTSAQSVKLWVDGTNSYLSSGNTGADPLILNAGGGNVGIGATTVDANLHVNRNTNTANNLDSLGFDVAATIGNAASNPGNHYTSGLRLFQGSGTVGSGLGVFYIGTDNGAAAATNDYTGQLIAPSGMTGGIKLNAADSSATIRFETAGSERMRIDNSGRVMMGGITSHLTNAGFNPVLNISTAINPMYLKNTGGGAVSGFQSGGTLGTQYFAVFYNGNGAVAGGISTSGGQTGVSVAYNTSSDYRLKENVDYTWDATTRLKQLKPARFNFIDDDTNTLVDGFLAHEVQDIVPEAITGEKDGVKEEEYEITPAVLNDDGTVVTEAVMGTREAPDYQGIDQSKLVPLLTKAIQEQQELINNLTARIEALEG